VWAVGRTEGKFGTETRRSQDGETGGPPFFGDGASVTERLAAVMLLCLTPRRRNGGKARLGEEC